MRLCDTALDILISIISHKSRTGLAPTVREISADCGNISLSHARYHLMQLEERGLLTLIREDEDGKYLSRSILLRGEKLTIPTIDELTAA